MGPGFPGSNSIPLRLQERLRCPSGKPTWKLPDIIILILYAGKDDNTCTAAAIQEVAPWLSKHLVELDNTRDKSQDMLADEPYRSLMHAAQEGRIRAVLGGPNCRTWSIRLHIPKLGGGKPLRGRSEQECWGLTTLTPSEQDKTDNDSILLLRQMELYHHAREHSTVTPAFLLEHPTDPVVCGTNPAASICASIWVTGALNAFQATYLMLRFIFDQCMMGQIVPKTTTILVDEGLAEAGLKVLDDMRCDHADKHKDAKIEDSSSLSRWAWGFNLLLAHCLAKHDSVADLKPPEWIPSSLDTEIELAKQATGQIHATKVTATAASGADTANTPAYLKSDRPTHAPQHHSFRNEDSTTVQIGFKSRPIRDGGGKTSWGRRHPKQRPKSHMAGLGIALANAAQASGMLNTMQISVMAADKEHPFTADNLHDLRIIIQQECGGSMEMSPGQPFCLDLISALAHKTGDPDWEYPLQLANGVPLGVDEPTWTTPGIWPTKEELSGQPAEDDEPEVPISMENYSSATLHEDTIEATYLEEREMGMTLGPFTLAEAAATCGCPPEQICCGPLGAREEADKIRTIHDGTAIHVNEHIRRNSAEKTTAPGLADLQHALMACRAESTHISHQQGTPDPRLKLCTSNSAAHSTETGDRTTLQDQSKWQPCLGLPVCHAPSSGHVQNVNHDPSSGHKQNLSHAPPSGHAQDINHAPSSGHAQDSSHAPSSGHAQNLSHAPSSGYVQNTSHAPSSGHAQNLSHAPSNGHAQDVSHAPSSGHAQNVSHVPSSGYAQSLCHAPSSGHAQDVSHAPSSGHGLNLSHAPSSGHAQSICHAPSSGQAQDTNTFAAQQASASARKCQQPTHGCPNTAPTAASGAEMGPTPFFHNSMHGEHEDDLILIKADVTKAHRRIKVLQKDWKYTAAQIKDQYWINTCGTYGIASAQLYWGRMAALLLRLLYLLFPDLQWAFVYVDDFMLVVKRRHLQRSGFMTILLLLVLGCPLSWKKTMIGTTNIWLGYQINSLTAWAQLTPKKMTTIVAILDALIQGTLHTAQEILELLGRLQWASAAYPYMRPFLQPIYAWQRATLTAGRPSFLIRTLAQCMMNIIQRPNKGRRSLPQQGTWLGFSDAAASQNTAGIGGWVSNLENPTKQEVFWFAFPTNNTEHPWAYDKGIVQRRIAALELYGTMLLFILLADFQQNKQPMLQATGGQDSPAASGADRDAVANTMASTLYTTRGQGPTAASGADMEPPLASTVVNIHIPLMTDNQGNAYAVLNTNTKRWPCSGILMEICAQAHTRDCHPAIQHVNREKNTWADQLSNLDFKGFAADRRLNIQVYEKDRLLVWPTLWDLHSRISPSPPPAAGTDRLVDEQGVLSGTPPLPLSVS